jgi:hypothetical protein
MYEMFEVMQSTEPVNLMGAEEDRKLNKKLALYGCHVCGCHVIDYIQVTTHYNHELYAQLHWCNPEPKRYSYIEVDSFRCPQHICVYCSNVAGCKKTKDISQRACMKFERMGKATALFTVIEVGPAQKRQSA